MSSPVALLAIPDQAFRQRLGATLSEMRWNVFEMSGGAETLSYLEASAAKTLVSEQAVILDKWLPDLDVREFFQDVQSTYPEVDLISVDGSMLTSRFASNSRRGELMHAIRTSQDWEAAKGSPPLDRDFWRSPSFPKGVEKGNRRRSPVLETGALLSGSESTGVERIKEIHPLPEFIGVHPAMLEVSRRIRLVAGRQTPVLIQGPSGTGKELVAKAIHRLSPRSTKPLVVLNCAAIPESLLEAELFGHTRGAFTGAVQGRVGRIEAANGGTLFLDEIGEMPLPLQSKLLRFLEAGEIQRVGDNETHTVDVRIISATHQPLAARSRQATFRADLFHRLAVFTIHTPPLHRHPEDIPEMANEFLRRLCDGQSIKRLHPSALELLLKHAWPGNVRELSHVVERALILAEDRCLIGAEEIEFVSNVD